MEEANHKELVEFIKSAGDTMRWEQNKMLNRNYYKV